MARIGELGYSEKYNRIELVVPHGTKLKDCGALLGKIFGGDLAARLPRSVCLDERDHSMFDEECGHSARLGDLP